MTGHPAFAGLLAAASIAALAVVAPAAGQWRDGQPPMASAAAGRAGQPLTLPAPLPGPDTDRVGMDRFTAAYGRAGRPRIVILWNRELTADVDTAREEVTTLSADGRSTAGGWRRETDTRHGLSVDAGLEADHHVDAELRTTTRTLDPGARTAAAGEADDFETERGFADALTDAGARLIDRTAIVRAGALGTDTANAQAIEMRALLARAEWTLEVVPMAGGRWRIVARDLAGGRVVARAVSAGRPAPRAMPYVAGERGFVRASAPVAGPYATGRSIALDTMRALAAR